MQQFVRFFAERLAEKLIINFGDVRILVRAAQCMLFVIFVETGSTLFADFVCGAIRLTAAADTTSAAGHDFDKVIRCFFALLLGGKNLVEHILHINQTMRNGDIDLGAL